MHHQFGKKQFAPTSSVMIMNRGDGHRPENGLGIKIANWIVDTIMLNDIQNSYHGNGINVHSAINISVNKIILIWD